MATNSLRAESALVTFPNRLPPMPAVQRILLRYARHDRETLEAFLSVAIELLDTLDGDADAESGNDLEDDFTLTDSAKGFGGRGPGCEVSDCDGPAWMERADQTAAPYPISTWADFRNGEDAEDDDPGEDEGDREQVFC